MRSSRSATRSAAGACPRACRSRRCPIPTAGASPSSSFPSAHVRDASGEGPRSRFLDDPASRPTGSARRNFRVLDEAIRDWFERTPAAEVLQRYQAAGIPVSLIYDAAAIAADPHIAARGSLVEVNGADGEPLLMQAPVPRFASGAAPIRWSGQPLGAANAEVYGGLLGLAETEIDHLRQDGVL